MPADAPQVKLAVTRELGAEVILYDRERDDREPLRRGLQSSAAPRSSRRSITRT